MTDRDSHATSPTAVGELPDVERPAAETLANWPSEEFRNAVSDALDRGLSISEIQSCAADIAVNLLLEEVGIKETARRLGISDRALQLRRAAERRRRQGGHDD